MEGVGYLFINYQVGMDKKRSVQVLYLGSIERGEDYLLQDKATDEIDFGRPVRVTLIRIPKLKRELYSKLTSVTQSEPIKNFEIFFRNLEETSGRYSLLTSNSELMATSTSDILITPTKGLVTDLLVLRGIFSKLSLCIYGDLVDENQARLWGKDCQTGEAGMAGEGCELLRERDIFEEKRQCIHKMERELQLSQKGGLNLSVMDNWQEAALDDDCNEPQIKNICNISQHLLNTFQQINEDTYIVTFRENIQNINNMLQKLFKSKQIGLYYNKQQNYALMNEIPLPLVHIGLSSLKLLPSDQFRVLEMIKMLAQLPRHANAIIEAGGVSQLCTLFLEFYKPGSVLFSTFKNLVLEVCIALSQWTTAAQRMVTKLDQDFYEEICKSIISQEKMEDEKQEPKDRQKEKPKDKDKAREKEKERSRSRDKVKDRRGRSMSDDESHGLADKDKKKKDKRDKKKRREKDKSREKEKSGQKSRKRDRSKEREEKKDKKDKDRKKEKEKQKTKQRQSKVKSEKESSPSEKMQAEQQDSNASVSNLSFYQLLFFILIKQKNSKTLNLIKILIQQIVQTLTKNKDISQQIALVTSFLRDTKYLFNQGSEIINSKSLKVFATFQPFLNEIQSENVDCKYISEKQKLKNPLKYGISPKTFKIVSRINQDIASFSNKDQYSFGTPFDESYMVMMSELIFEKDKPILSGFNRIVNSFRADGLMPLQRHEAAISITAEYIYRALLDDEGFNTLLYLDQIHGSLIKFISYLNEDPSLFSTQLKARIKLLSNYAVPYDNFSRAQGILKTFCEYFLRLFKYQNYEIQINNKAKLTDFRKKQYEKLINPFLYENLMQNFALKNFNDVSQSQPLLEIDVCLKIFLVLCDYNKNIWTTFYENKLVSGFSSLLNKVSSLLIFYLTHSANRWTSYASIKSYLPTIDNYLTVVKHVLMLLAKKCRYQSAYNDLLQEDIFEDVELYEQSIEIFISLYNAYHDQSMMIYISKSMTKIKVILTLVIKILDHFLTSNELSNHQTRESKLTKLIEHLYIKHYSSLSSRPAILAIFAHLVKLSEGSTTKYFLQNILDNSFKQNKLFSNQIAYIPSNDRSIVENLIKTNIYRANPLIVNNLGLLLKYLFSKQSLVDKSLDIVDRLFEEIDESSKKDEEEEGQMSWTSMRKAHLFSEVLVQTGVTFKSRLDDKMMRFFKRMLEISRKKIVISELKEKLELQNFIVFLKLKNNFMTYFGRLVRQNTENNLFLNYYELTAKTLTFEYFLINCEEQENPLVKAINLEVLRSCKLYVESLAQVSLNAYYQCLLLYGQVLEKPYKPQTIINFAETLNFLQKLYSQNRVEAKSLEMSEMTQIICSIFYFLGNLTTIDGQNLFTTESRRQAIIHLISPNEKEFPFKWLKGTQSFKFIPKDLLSILEEFFNYPIVEKSIIIKQKYEPKQNLKSKNLIYSKSVFSIVSEHEPVSKTRYKYIGGEWVGGDIQRTLYSPFRVRNYEEEIEKILLSKAPKEYEQYHLRAKKFSRQNITYNELFYLHMKKDRQQIPKKEVEKTIQLKDVIPRFTPRQIKKQIVKPPSPSPSKITGQINSGYVGSNNQHMSSRSPASHEKYNNRGSNPRSNSQSNNNPQQYQSPSRYYNPRSSMPPSGPMPMPGMPNPGYGGHIPPPQHNYPQQSYPPPNYYGSPPPMPPPNMYPRYPQSYPPPGGPGMYMTPQPVYDSRIPQGMYGQPPPNMLNQYEEQLFHQALSLLNEIKTSSLSESDMNKKKDRLNHILSNYSKVHQKLKESLPQKS